MAVPLGTGVTSFEIVFGATGLLLVLLLITRARSVPKGLTPTLLCVPDVH
jgi:hypothetical protein